MGTTVNDLKELIADVMVKKGINNYEIDLSAIGLKGDNYLTEVTYVTVIATNENGEKKPYPLIVKAAKQSDEFRKQTPVKEIFTREVFMYANIFPAFRDFQIQCGIKNPVDLTAEFYSGCLENKKETLILANLKTEGYEIHDRQVPQNFNHVRFVFQNYGKFHAISLALRHKKPAMYKNLTREFTDGMEHFFTTGLLMPGCIEAFNTGIKALRKNGKEAIAVKYDGFADNIEMFLTNLSNPESENSAILHGDCWPNNIMFKYKGENKATPVNMRLVDFQLTRIGSPVFDLSYYLYTSADKSVLDKFDLLLESYHSSLSSFLKEFGCDAKNILTLNELKAHWKNYGRFGVALSPLLLKLQHSEADEVVDYAACAENGTLAEAFDFTLRLQDVFEKRVMDILNHFAENFL